jgi:hypothetical protein
VFSAYTFVRFTCVERERDVPPWIAYGRPSTTNHHHFPITLPIPSFLSPLHSTSLPSLFFPHIFHFPLSNRSVCLDFLELIHLSYFSTRLSGSLISGPVLEIQLLKGQHDQDRKYSTWQSKLPIFSSTTFSGIS